MEILPYLTQHIPTLTCRLIGSAMPHALHMLTGPNVEIIGHVSDIGSALEGVTLCVAPLRFGAGIKGKILEAWSFGLPIIMTPTASEGIVADDHPVLKHSIAGAADAFAQSILKHLKPSVAKAHITAARALLRERFTEENITSAFQPFLPSCEPPTREEVPFDLH
ncbi:hypothetical protein AA106555_1888 [Neokomagataea thailandica NBRC 106555]|nr:hypothetical protein AA106555_1888 [Neokomagataea thailandica NBRC 106555]